MRRCVHTARIENARSAVQQTVRLFQDLAALNLLAAIVICWNTDRLAKAGAERQDAGQPAPQGLSAHTSPPVGAHILTTGEYKSPKRR